MMKKIHEGIHIWPRVNGEDVPTQVDPVTGLPFCKDCWNGKHPRNGCEVPACKCGCYQGKNKGLGKPHVPSRDCEENQELPDVGGFDL